MKDDVQGSVNSSTESAIANAAGLQDTRWNLWLIRCYSRHIILLLELNT